jgi:predicted SprT family Zn-dependent metalloprotease
MIKLKNILNEMNFQNIKTKDDIIKYAKLKWRILNLKYFKDQLNSDIKITLQKNTDAERLSRLGSYIGDWNMITLHPRLVNAGKEVFDTVLCHEMCHQAVHDIDKTSEIHIHQGHGPLWVKWMKKCHLPPDIKSDVGVINLMTSREKTEFEIKKQEIEKAKKERDDKNMKRVYPEEMKPAQFYSNTELKWVKGLIVCPNDKKGERWAFADKLGAPTWKIVMRDKFYELPEDEKSKYLNSDWVNTSERIKNYYIRQEQNKQLKRSFRYI